MFFCNKSQRATFLAEEHLPVGAEQGAYAFLISLDSVEKMP